MQQLWALNSPSWWFRGNQYRLQGRGLAIALGLECLGHGPVPGRQCYYTVLFFILWMRASVLKNKTHYPFFKITLFTEFFIQYSLGYLNEDSIPFLPNSPSSCAKTPKQKLQTFAHVQMLMVSTQTASQTAPRYFARQTKFHRTYADWLYICSFHCHLCHLRLRLRYVMCFYNSFLPDAWENKISNKIRYFIAVKYTLVSASKGNKCWATAVRDEPFDFNPQKWTCVFPEKQKRIGCARTTLIFHGRHPIPTTEKAKGECSQQHAAHELVQGSQGYWSITWLKDERKNVLHF